MDRSITESGRVDLLVILSLIKEFLRLSPSLLNGFEDEFLKFYVIGHPIQSSPKKKKKNDFRLGSFYE